MNKGELCKKIVDRMMSESVGISREDATAKVESLLDIREVDERILGIGARILPSMEVEVYELGTGESIRVLDFYVDWLEDSIGSTMLLVEMLFIHGVTMEVLLGIY